jgi:hypothetical protein
VKVVQNRSGQKLAQWPAVPGVRAPQGREVATTRTLVDDRRREAEPYEKQIQNQSTGAAVAVEERMNLLKVGVQRGQPLRDGRILSTTELLDFHNPVADKCRHLRPARWVQASGEGLNLMLAKGARPLSVAGLRMWCDVPDRGHCKCVDVPYLGKRDQLAIGPGTWLNALAVHPVRCVGVSTDLVVFAQFPIPDGAPFLKEDLDLFEDQSVPLDGR